MSEIATPGDFSVSGAWAICGALARSLWYQRPGDLRHQLQRALKAPQTPVADALKETQTMQHGTSEQKTPQTPGALQTLNLPQTPVAPQTSPNVPSGTRDTFDTNGMVDIRGTSHTKLVLLFITFYFQHLADNNLW